MDGSSRAAVDIPSEYVPARTDKASQWKLMLKLAGINSSSGIILILFYLMALFAPLLPLNETTV
jgi:hypothetical protein